MTSQDLEQALTERFTHLFGTDTIISRLRQLTGGASRDTWAFEVATDVRESSGFVLRRDPAGEEDPKRMALEVDSLREAARASVPVPEVVDCSSESAGAGIGLSYLIMSYVAGEALPQKLLRGDRYKDVRAGMAYEMGRTLARIHAMDPGRIPGLPQPDPLEDYFERYNQAGDPVPTLDLAFRWLFDNRPGSTRSTVVHGDFRTGNVLVSDEGLAAVLDWELVHFGDPMEDLGWLCTPSWRFGSDHPVGGFGSREDLFRGYRDGGGTDPDPAAVEWWEIFGSIRWAVICREQARRADSGSAENELELLAIGRRVAECEHDLLEAFDWPKCEIHASENTARSGDLYGSPYLGQLLSAVRNFVLDATQDAEPVTRYRARVAANVLAISEREWRRGARAREEYNLLLKNEGFADETELALAIRTRNVDVRRPSVTNLIARGAAERLAVAHPDY